MTLVALEAGHSRVVVGTDGRLQEAEEGTPGAMLVSSVEHRSEGVRLTLVVDTTWDGAMSTP